MVEDFEQIKQVFDEVGLKYFARRYPRFTVVGNPERRKMATEYFYYEPFVDITPCPQLTGLERHRYCKGKEFWFPKHLKEETIKRYGPDYLTPQIQRKNIPCTLFPYV